MDAELRAACTRAIHVFTEDGRLLSGGRAALELLGRVGWPRTARLLGLPPLIWFVELGYRIIAANRRRMARIVMRDPSLEERAALQLEEAQSLAAEVAAHWAARRAGG